MHMAFVYIAHPETGNAKENHFFDIITIHAVAIALIAWIL